MPAAGAAGSLTAPAARANARRNGPTWYDCELTWYDPGLGGTNSSNGQADPHAKTASGEPYDRTKFTCAAPPSFPFGTNVRIRAGGKEVTVRVNDRGGGIRMLSRTKAHFDLSVAARDALGGATSGKYTVTDGASALGPNTGQAINNAVNGAVDSVGGALSSISNLLSKVFSVQALYVAGGGLLILIALVLIAHESITGAAGAAARTVRKAAPVD